MLTNVQPGLRRGWHPVARSEALTDRPLAVELLGERWVVARLDGREPVAFADRCPHRLAPLSAGRVEGAELVCGYHGWRFDGSGARTAVPALGPAAASGAPRAGATAAWGVREQHGLVWLAPDAPRAGIIDWPDYDHDRDHDRDHNPGDDGAGPGFDVAWLDVVATTAAAGLLADNFLDTAHLPFVHAATIGADEGALVPPYDVTPAGAGFRVSLDQTVANPEDPGVAAGARPPRQRRLADYEFVPPFMMRLRMEYPEAGTVSDILFCLQPENAGRTRIYTRIARNDLGGDPERIAAAVAFERRILAEDLALQEQFAIDGLPLGGRGRAPGEPIEVSIRPDAAGLALRRALRAFVGPAEPAEREPVW